MGIYGFEDFKSCRTAKLPGLSKSYQNFNDVFWSMTNWGFFGSGSSLPLIMEDSAWEGPLPVGVSDRWKVTTEPILFKSLA